MRTVDIEWLLSQLLRRKGLFLAGLCAGLALGTAAYLSLPKKFKAVARLNVSPRYFQSPMMRDFLPEVYDPSELKSEREAALVGSLTPEFLSRIATQQHGPAASPLQRDRQIADLRKNFEILRENATTFQVAALAGDPEKAYALCTELTKQILVNARETRLQFLRQLHDAVADRLRRLSGTSIQALSNRELDRQIAVLEGEKSRLLTSFLPSHPQVRELERRIALLHRQGGSDAETPATAATSPDLSDLAPAEIKNRLLEDLLRKYQMLQIVLELEGQENASYVTVLEAPLRPSQPVSPQRPVFLAWSLILGLFLGMGLVLFASRRDWLRAEETTPRLQDGLFENKGRPSGWSESPLGPADEASP